MLPITLGFLVECLLNYSLWSFSHVLTIWFRAWHLVRLCTSTLPLIFEMSQLDKNGYRIRFLLVRNTDQRDKISTLSLSFSLSFLSDLYLNRLQRTSSQFVGTCRSFLQFPAEVFNISLCASDQTCDSFLKRQHQTWQFEMKKFRTFNTNSSLFFYLWTERICFQTDCEKRRCHHSTDKLTDTSKHCYISIEMKTPMWKTD